MIDLSADACYFWWDNVNLKEREFMQFLCSFLLTCTTTKKQGL